jgi:hypothetical protein
MKVFFVSGFSIIIQVDIRRAIILIQHSLTGNRSCALSRFSNPPLVSGKLNVDHKLEMIESSQQP